MAGYLYTATELSRYVVGKCARDEKPVSNLQLQKMLYFLQSVYCRATKGSLLFPDEFEAWPYGPVIASVYKEFSKYGGDVIDEYREIKTLDFGNATDSGNAAKNFLDAGIEELREKSPWELVRTSHAPNSPWAKVYKGGDGYKDTIPNSLIIEAATKVG